MKRISIALILLTACASSPPPPPHFTELPESALEVMCARFHAEGMTSELRVVKETQALATPASLQALSEVSNRSTTIPPDIVRTIVNTPLLPLEMPSKSCAARFITAADIGRASDVMILQFSSPFANPFARNQTGVLARLSLGSEVSTWYWVPLMNQNDRWLAGTPSALSVIE